MGNVLAELHLLLMVVSFVWHGISTYAATDAGQAELKDIEDVYNGIQQVEPSGASVASTIENSLNAARAKVKSS